MKRIDGSESKSDIKTAGSLEGACQPFYIVCAFIRTYYIREANYAKRVSEKTIIKPKVVK